MQYKIKKIYINKQINKIISCQPKIKVQTHETKFKMLVTRNQTLKISISCKSRSKINFILI